MAKNNLVPDRIQAVWNILGGDEGIDDILAGKMKVELTPISKAVSVALLVMVGTTAVSATTNNFVAKEKFVINTTDGTKVKIYELGSNFKANFLDKVEELFSGSELKIQKLSEGSRDTKIITELGGDEKAETSLTEVFSQMEKQPNGEKGALLTNGYANIFYCRDVNGVLWAVSVSWDGNGWHVYADSLDDLSDWGADRHVFSRN